jgi:hypothetical protein
MSFLIVTPDQNTKIEAINPTLTDRNIVPVATADGTLLIPANLNNDPYWSAYQGVISTLTPLVGNPVWPVSDSEQIS